MTKQKRTNPQTKEEWAEFWQKNKELTKKIQESMKSYVDMDDVAFKNSLISKESEELIAMRGKMKADLNFYRKILQEPYYVEHPQKKSTIRYEEAFRICQSISSKGKIISVFINNFNPSQDE